MALQPKKAHIPNLHLVLRKVAVAVKEEATAAMEDYADQVQIDFVSRIEGQEFESFQEILYPDSGTNLSPRWLARKKAAGADLRTMIARGWYTGRIEVFSKRLGRHGREYRVGFHALVKARDLDGKIVDITLNRVAWTHEKGSAKMKIPARPHWKPQLDKLKKEHPKAAQDMADRVAAAAKKSSRKFVEAKRS